MVLTKREIRALLVYDKISIKTLKMYFDLGLKSFCSNRTCNIEEGKNKKKLNIFSL